MTGQPTREFFSFPCRKRLPAAQRAWFGLSSRPTRRSPVVASARRPGNPLAGVERGPATAIQYNHSRTAGCTVGRKKNIDATTATRRARGPTAHSYLAIQSHTVLAIASWRIIIYYCHYRVLYIYVADACGEPLFNNVLMHCAS